MTTAATPTDPRIELARTRRMLEDTALAAVPGTLVALHAHPAADHLWTAEVRSIGGRHLTVELDRLLQTVAVHPVAVARAA